MQEKVGTPKLDAVLAVQELMKVGGGGSSSLLSFAGIAAWCPSYGWEKKSLQMHVEHCKTKLNSELEYGTL